MIKITATYEHDTEGAPETTTRSITFGVKLPERIAELVGYGLLWEHDLTPADGCATVEVHRDGCSTPSRPEHAESTPEPRPRAPDFAVGDTVEVIARSEPDDPPIGSRHTVTVIGEFAVHIGYRQDPGPADWPMWPTELRKVEAEPPFDSAPEALLKIRRDDLSRYRRSVESKPAEDPCIAELLGWKDLHDKARRMLYRDFDIDGDPDRGHAVDAALGAAQRYKAACKRIADLLAEPPGFVDAARYEWVCDRADALRQRADELITERDAARREFVEFTFATWHGEGEPSRREHAERLYPGEGARLFPDEHAATVEVPATEIRVGDRIRGDEVVSVDRAADPGWVDVSLRKGDSTYVVHYRSDDDAEVLRAVTPSRSEPPIDPREQQRLGFVHGNVSMSNADVTREHVAAAAERVDAADVQTLTVNACDVAVGDRIAAYADAEVVSIERYQDDMLFRARPRSRQPDNVKPFTLRYRSVESVNVQRPVPAKVVTAE